MNTTCDILISGGGIAGLSAAAVFGAAGFNVICVDPAPPITKRDVDGSDAADCGSGWPRTPPP